MTRIRTSIEAWVSRGSGSSRRVLLLHVPDGLNGDHPGFWQPVTGGVHDGETTRAAAVREIAEETALTLKTDELIEVIVSLDVPISPELTVRKTVFVTAGGQGQVRTSPEEHDGHRWCPPEEVSMHLYWESNRTTWAAACPRVC
jgi:dATP pyrophosphohydrolase